MLTLFVFRRLFGYISFASILLRVKPNNDYNCIETRWNMDKLTEIFMIQEWLWHITTISLINDQARMNTPQCSLPLACTYRNVQMAKAGGKIWSCCHSNMRANWLLFAWHTNTNYNNELPKRNEGIKMLAFVMERIAFIVQLCIYVNRHGIIISGERIIRNSAVVIIFIQLNILLLNAQRVLYLLLKNLLATNKCIES